MKNLSFLLPMLLLSIISLTNLSCVEGKAKDGGKEIASERNLSQTEKLSATAKVWGFLKYYHPQVAKGKFNWDEQLFAVLEEVEDANTPKELSDVLSKWIDNLGEVEKCNSCLMPSTREVFSKNFDLSWLDSDIFSKELSKKLKFIENNRVQGDQYYIAAGQVGNVVVQNEQEYDDFTWEEKELRLLTLFRYWNQVEYFFPYKYQMDRDWDESLETLLPVFLDAGNEQEFHLAMLKLAASLDDSHAWLITNHTNGHYGFYWAPVKLKMIDGKAVVTGMHDFSLAAKDDWRPGDILTAVAGVSVSQLISEEFKYMYGSNLPAKYRDLEIPLLNGSTNSVEVEYLRDGKLQAKKVNRYLKSEFSKEKPEEPTWKILDGNIGYVNMGILENKEVKKMMKELDATKAIIFDIRNYPKGTLYNIAERINTEDRPFVKFTVPDLSYPGKFNWEGPLSAGKKNPKAYKGKVILLVNEDTQSHAEFTAMALQTAPDVTIVGSQTSGADGNVSDISFLGKFRTYMTGIGVFYPDGRETQRIGIVPDIEVKPSIEGVKQERDEVLEKALEVVRQKTS